MNKPRGTYDLRRSTSTLSPRLPIVVYKLMESGIVTIDVDVTAYPAFRELVQRATDKWPDAPDYIKHFADIITNGKPMQDYFANPHLSGKVKANGSDRSS